MRIKELLIGCLFLLVGCKPGFRVERLTCDYHTDPIAIENVTPGLSWQIKSEDREVFQQAYRILVADQEALLDKDQGNIWDSGVVESDQSVQVQYAGEALDAYQIYYWKVKVWDQNGRETSWSNVAQWRQVPKNPKMSWIGFSNEADRKDQVSSIWFRKSFQLDDFPQGSVYAEIATPGYYELYVNGQKVGEDVLSPSTVGKDKRTLYMTYDIESYLHKGENVIGIWLAKGWYGMGPIPVAFHCAIPQEKEILVMNTDTTWKAAPSAYATLGSWDWAQFGGECYDARMKNDTWYMTGFDDTLWANAEQLQQPSPFLEAQPCELNRENEPVSYQQITKLDKDCYEIDFGKALTGNYRIQFPALKRGDTIRMYFADVRWNSAQAVQTPAGLVRSCGIGERLFTCKEDTFRYSTHNQYSFYIASGEGEEVFASKFNPLGFRYIIVEGLKEQPLAASASLVETDLERTGTFACSDSLLMKMHQVNDWTMRCLNQGAVYVDCPTRERLGYGDGQVSVESSIMNYYMPSFYRKFVRDWALRQNPETGELPNVAPNYQGGGGPGWAGLVAAITWRNYLYYGDIAFLKEIYPVMKKYLDNFESRCVDNLFQSSDEPILSIGDWVAPGRGMDTNNWPTQEMAEFFNNCYRVYLWSIQYKAALALGMSSDALACKRKLDTIRPIIHERYYNAEKGYYVSDEQPYLLMPLMTDVVPEDLRGRLWDHLEKNILEGRRFQTGMFGTYFLIQYLQEQDRSDLLYKLIAHTEYPGWGYMLTQGATTWWEQWNGYFSHIHSCFTSLDSWFYQGIAGIRCIDEAIGMKRFKIKPAFDLPLASAKASVQSMYGEITSAWKKEKNTISFCVVIPPNSQAEVCFPVGMLDVIKESDKPLSDIEGVDLLKSTASETICLVSSGTYEFSFPL